MTDGIKLVCFDLNKTLINETTWLELNLAMGMSQQEDEAMLQQYLAGTLTYLDWQRRLEKIYLERGRATQSRILEAINHYTYKPGVREVIAELKSRNYELVLLSGSIDQLVEKIADELGITMWGANNYFIFNDRGSLKRFVCRGEDAQVKVGQLQQFCDDLKISPRQCACVGDGDNDQGIFELTGHGITFKGSKIEHKAWKVINQLPDLIQIF